MMSETVTLEIPDELARRARAPAAATHRRFEDAVVDWLRRAVEGRPSSRSRTTRSSPSATRRSARPIGG